MILISKQIYKKLSKIKKAEDCGFVAGNDVITEMYPIKNVSKNKNEFKMSFWQKMIAIIKIVWNNYNVVGVYHVHDNSPVLSSVDAWNAFEGVLYIIVCKKKLYFYKIVRDELNEAFFGRFYNRVIALQYKILEDSYVVNQQKKR